MTDRILNILDNVRYWDTCPEDYKKDITEFLDSRTNVTTLTDLDGMNVKVKVTEYIPKIVIE